MRKFLVIMDNSPEFLNALRYAAIRASKTGGAVEILGIIGPEDFQHWLGVGEAMRVEARERIEAHFEVFAKWMIEKEGVEPELVVREGEKVSEILAQIKQVTPSDKALRRPCYRRSLHLRCAAARQLRAS